LFLGLSFCIDRAASAVVDLSVNIRQSKNVKTCIKTANIALSIEELGIMRVSTSLEWGLWLLTILAKRVDFFMFIIHRLYVLQHPHILIKEKNMKECKVSC
jgi:hypothetical protein